MNPKDLMRVSLTVDEMRSNSRAWHDAGPEEKERLAKENQALGQKLDSLMTVPVVYQPDGGTWHVGSIDGPLLFELY